jgi:hypothetical protein
MRFQPRALAALREGVEQFETDLLRMGNTLSIHRGKMTLDKRDLSLASTLLLAPHVQQEHHGSAKLLGGVLKIMRREGPESIGNEKKPIRGRAEGHKARTLRKFTQDTAHEAVADPPGLLNEEEEAQKFVDASSMDFEPETDEIVADSDEEDEPSRDDEIDHEEA